MVLLPALNPDVSIVHVQKSDCMGNVIIEGFTTHEPVRRSLITARFARTRNELLYPISI